MSKRGRKQRAPEAIEAAESPTEIRHQDPYVAVRSKDLKVWPEDRPLPEHYIKRSLMPCRFCRRVLLDNLGTAVMVTGVTKAKAYFECKACRRRWSLPVRVV